MLRNILGWDFPLLNKGAKTIEKQVLRSGIDVANDFMQEKDVQLSTKQRAKEAGKSLAVKTATKVKNIISSGRKKRKLKLSKRMSHSKV